MKALSPWGLGGIVLLAAGTILAIGGGTLYFLASQAETPASVRERLHAQCVEVLSKSWKVSYTPRRIRIESDDISDPRREMSDASALPALCPGYTISRFCLGSDCPDAMASSGISMIVDLVPATSP